MVVDHVVYGVRDLDSAVQRLWDVFGLKGSGGGVHDAFGTANQLVPVSPSQYVELMTVHDPGSQHPLRIMLSQWIADGDRPVGVALRPHSLDQAVARLGVGIAPGNRRNPDGAILEWRLAGMEAALGPERLPFFIDWGSSLPLLKAQLAAGLAQHRIHPLGFSRIDMGGDPARLRDWVGDVDPVLSSVGGEPGPHAIGIQTTEGEIVLT